MSLRLLSLRWSCASFVVLAILTPMLAWSAPPHCASTVKARVVALEQVYSYNRFGSFNPMGMMYALERDVVPVEAREGARHLEPGNVMLRDDKRPRPLVLRVNQGDCLEVTFTNLLMPRETDVQEIFRVPGYFLEPPVPGLTDLFVDSEFPHTRSASMHVNGLDYVDGVTSDGANVGGNISSLAAPGETRVYKWYAAKPGSYLFYSMGAAAGGEGDGGQLGLGLFGAVNVEPRGAKWYRSQVTAEVLARATRSKAPDQGGFSGTPVIDYEAADPGGLPLLNMLGPGKEIVHSDLNAVIVFPASSEDCVNPEPSSTCGMPFREFTTLFHDEITAEQAFPELTRSPMQSIKDGMAINYGSAGMGAPVVANRHGVGPTAACPECKFEEFFLSSWANGDPSMVVRRDEMGRETVPYRDDPSNVHHSYLGDPVRFRTIHAGPKETHVFHLHAHQWVHDATDRESTYLDSQTLTPGASFTFDIQYGGSGNRNFTPGDSIFHCHLYPHFAQGMWELWRTHDVFEDGSPSRNLPDKEISGGTPNPAIIPIPDLGLPPMPSSDFPGYPFYVAGMAGHRAPQPPLDMDNQGGEELNGGLPRHRIGDCSPRTDCVADGPLAIPGEMLDPAKVPSGPADLYDQGRRMRAVTAKRVNALNGDPSLLSFAAMLTKVPLEVLPQAGTVSEVTAMRFHSGDLFPSRTVRARNPPPSLTPLTEAVWIGKAYTSHDAAGIPKDFVVNGYKQVSGAPFADPCEPTASGPRPMRRYRAAYVQMDMTVNKWGWHDPQARIAVLERDVRDTLDRKRLPEPLFFRANSGDCISFAATNLLPSALDLDDFQVYSPTDVIGQHIHLVKFDVTSSDGSENGFNYEDGTLSPDEVRERIAANNAFPGAARLAPRTHPMFRPGGALDGDRRGLCGDRGGSDDNVWCGAQTTLQRWWADPLLDRQVKGHDRTLRTVFTHDHFGPSSHQHHGLYAALVVEPEGSVWKKVKGFDPTPGAADLGTRAEDGGPTSYAADIIAASPARKGSKQTQAAAASDRDRREFNLAFADFAIVYTAEPELAPVNPPNRAELEVPLVVTHEAIPIPEGISGGDPGTQLINYRNEPIPLRIAEPDGQKHWVQKPWDAGDMAHVFSSKTHAPSEPHSDFLDLLMDEPERKAGDPATPLLVARPGQKLQIRLIQGAQEENHVFTLHGARWLEQISSRNSGYQNAQPIGISEHFEAEFELPLSRTGKGTSNDVLIPSTDHLYSSSATDNLWDGMWGLLRVAQETNAGLTARMAARLGSTGTKARSSSTRSLDSFTQDLNEACPSSLVGARSVVDPAPFDVSAWLARDIVPTTSLLSSGSLLYSKPFGITDPNAIVFVTDVPGVGKNGQQEALQARYANRAPGPLVLRAAAGTCITLKLTNHLPKSIDDGPDSRETWSYMMLPPLIDGFNFNQVRMSNRVSLHPQLLSTKLYENDGSHVGLNDDSTVAPGKEKNYQWFAGKRAFDGRGIPVEFGAIGLHDMGDVIKHASHGAIGELIIEPQGAVIHTDENDDASANICEAGSSKAACVPGSPHFLFRDFAILYQDDLSLRQNGQPMLNLRNGDDAEDSGQKAFNYRTEPLWARVGAGSPAISPEELSTYDFTDALSSKVPNAGCDTPPCDPYTPIFHAPAGIEVRFRIVHPAGHPRNHGFTLFGHNWQYAPWVDESTVMASLAHPAAHTAQVGSYGGIGPARHLNLVTRAGGAFARPGDYLYRTQESFMFQGGLWGIFRVDPPLGSKP